jgi:hypothetical protein
MKKKLIPVNFSKKTRKATTKIAPASAAYAPTIHVSEVDGISNEIKFLLSFTLFKTVHYICAEKSFICAHNTITFALIFSS